jgi:hypothetical protein
MRRFHVLAFCRQFGRAGRRQPSWLHCGVFCVRPSNVRYRVAGTCLPSEGVERTKATRKASIRIRPIPTPKHRGADRRGLPFCLSYNYVAFLSGRNLFSFHAMEWGNFSPEASASAVVSRNSYLLPQVHMQDEGKPRVQVSARRCACKFPLSYHRATRIMSWMLRFPNHARTCECLYKGKRPASHGILGHSVSTLRSGDVVRTWDGMSAWLCPEDRGEGFSPLRCSWLT